MATQQCFFSLIVRELVPLGVLLLTLNFFVLGVSFHKFFLGMSHISLFDHKLKLQIQSKISIATIL